MRDWYRRPGVGGYPDVIAPFDVFSKMKFCEPISSLDTLDVNNAIKFYVGSDHDKVDRIYCDNFKSLKNAIRNLGIVREASQPGIHYNNAIIERCNQDIENGARSSLIQGGCSMVLVVICSTSLLFCREHYS
jgi:hypothetical protein